MLVRPVLLYGCETWKMNNSGERKMDSFRYKGLKKIMQLGWPNIVSMDEVNKITQVPRISQEVKRKRWNWIGHVIVKGAQSSLQDCLDLAKRKVGREGKWKREGIRLDGHHGMQQENLQNSGINGK
uniref:Uncharacterized protein n=1 Tax=Octopus bimaculoides TaxID=37653 RepID=A0A0L8GQN1_OCTBM